MKRLIIIFLFLVLLLVIYLIYEAFIYYAPPQTYKPYTITKKNDDTLRIAYIGDSWANYHTPFDSIMSKMAEAKLHIPVKVSSYGICGLTSKEIYEQFFLNEGIKTFLSKGYDYCFISAGINDTYKKMSIKYYEESMDNIIQFMLINQIIPIILEIPDYDIEKVYYNQKISKRLLRIVSMRITGMPINCKQTFRNALDELIQRRYKANKIQVIRYKEWNAHFRIDLDRLYHKDGMHLNNEGYEALDSCIIGHIYKLLTH